MNKKEKRQYDRDYHKKRSPQAKKRKQALQKSRRLLIKAKWDEWKASQGCISCPENTPVCLDMHHRDPSEKELNISDAVAHGWGWKRIMQEAAKCVVVCANCHRKLHI